MQDRLKRLKLIVVGAVTLLFILVVVLIFQIGTGANRSAEIRRQERLLNDIRDQIYRLGLDIEYFDSDRFIIEFALSQGWIIRG